MIVPIIKLVWVLLEQKAYPLILIKFHISIYKELHPRFNFPLNYWKYLLLHIKTFSVQAAYAFKEKIVAEVIAGNMTVVCDGITSDIIPGLDDSKVPGFFIDPIGPHPVGNFAVKALIIFRFVTEYYLIFKGRVVQMIFSKLLFTAAELHFKHYPFSLKSEVFDILIRIIKAHFKFEIKCSHSTCWQKF